MMVSSCKTKAYQTWEIVRFLLLGISSRSVSPFELLLAVSSSPFQPINPSATTIVFTMSNSAFLLHSRWHLSPDLVGRKKYREKKVNSKLYLESNMHSHLT